MPSGTSDKEAAEALPGWLEGLNKKCGIEPMRELVDNFDDYEAKLEDMAQAACDSGSPSNNPRVPTINEMVHIYREIW